MRTLLALVLIVAVGCGSLGTRAPASSPSPASTEIRSSRHSEALAESLRLADNAGQAEFISHLCDFGHASGSLNGFRRGQAAEDGLQAVHCLETIREIGWASRSDELCPAPKREREDTYGKDLLHAVQKCHGDMLCTQVTQASFIRCYTAGLEDGYEKAMEDVLEVLLINCKLPRVNPAKCEAQARSEIREFEAVK